MDDKSYETVCSHLQSCLPLRSGVDPTVQQMDALSVLVEATDQVKKDLRSVESNVRSRVCRMYASMYKETKKRPLARLVDQMAEKDPETKKLKMRRRELQTMADKLDDFWRAFDHRKTMILAKSRQGDQTWH